MAVERDKAEWNRLAAVIATIKNSNSTKGNQTKPEDCTPYGKKSKGNRVRLNRKNIDLMRNLAGTSRK